MEISKLEFDGLWSVELDVYSDGRGSFFEWFQNSTFTSITNNFFSLAQANCSVSHAGVIRGIHFAKYPPGQAKFVTCLTGSVFDVMVDLRKGSPTFGKWTSKKIDSRKPSSIFIPSGFGHGFMSLEDNTVFVYLCDENYNPLNEIDINPLDATLGIKWPEKLPMILSEKDEQAEYFINLMHHFPNFSDFN